MRKLSLLTCLFVAVLTACAPTAAPRTGQDNQPSQAAPTTPQRTLVVALRGEPPTLATKELVGFSGALRDLQQAFNADLDGKDARGESYPYLAEQLPKIDTDTWKVFPDGRMETTYKLKPNLTWHDGHALTSDDFVFSWQVYSTPALGAAGGSPIKSMDEVVALDARTFVIKWKELYAEANELGTRMNTSLLPALPAHILRQPLGTADPLEFTNLPYWSNEYVGLGPYKLAKWEPGTFVDGEAFDGHALGRPKIDRLHAIFTPDPNTALAQVLAGEVHYVGQFVLASDHGDTLEQQWGMNQGGTVLYAPVGFRRGVVQLRPELVTPKALVDVRVRRAVMHALDKSGAAEVLQGGKGLIADAFLSSKVPFYPEIDRAITKYPYDTARTRQLMDEAGFTRGGDGFFVGRDGTPFEMEVASSAGTKNEQENTVIVDALRNAGFNARTYILAAAQSREGENYMQRPGILVWGGGGDMSALEHFTTEQTAGPANRWRGNNYNAWSNPDYDRLYDEFGRSLRATDRVRLMADMNRVLTVDLPWIPYWYQPLVTAHVSSLRGPLTREVPDAPNGMLKIHEWSWRS